MNYAEDYTEDQLINFLRTRGYKIATYKGAALIKDSDDVEVEHMTNVIVAMKKNDVEGITSLFKKEDIEAQYGIAAVFNKEMAKTLLRL